MKCLLPLTLALIVSPAWATGKPESKPTQATTQTSADSRAASTAHSAATSTASQTQTATGSATQSQTANGGNSQAVNNGNNASQAISFDATKRAAASAHAPTVYASSVCAVGWSAGAQFVGVGASGGKSRTDKGCELRENIRIVASLNPALALKAACQLEGIREVATEADCTYDAPVTPKEPPVTVIVPPAPVAADSGYVTHSELVEALKRQHERAVAK